jgi:N-acylneuraminate cytidylyltransferase
MRIAVIPARGGSKRIPRKNIKPFLGKPMIAWSIEAAFGSKIFDKVIVSTDDAEIAEIAVKYGAEVPFIRPENLSDDMTMPAKVVSHTVQWALDQKWDIEAICCIYATAPFISQEDLKECYRLLTSGPWAYSFPVTKFSASIFRAFKILPSGGAEMFQPENFNKRSQDLEQAYHDSGQFYWGTCESWLKEKILFTPDSFPLVIPKWRVQDIDDEDDWCRAELLAKSILNLETNNKL